MGKGFNNYMCKKFFHPASRDNLKRVWMAEQKADSYKKKQDELRVQYEKEQDLYNNKAILSKESKDKLSVNFMYEPPPGAKKEREREDNEPEYKFEWQRKFNAPREDYCKGDSEIRDQPFGIQVRNVRCIKCHKWGHINTDKECPMYNQTSTSQMLNSSDPLLLIQQMRDDGLTIKRRVLEAQQHLQVPVANQKGIILSEEDDDNDDNTITPTEKQFLKSLSKKQKIKLLKKLERMEKKKKLTSKKRKKDKKKKKSSKHVASQSSSSSSETDESDADKEESKNKRKHKRMHKEKDGKEKKKKSMKRESHSDDSKDSVNSESKNKKNNKRKYETIDKDDKNSKKKRK